MTATNETKLNHSLKMSRKILLNTKVKNQHEHNKLGFTLKQMSKDKEKQEIKCYRDITSTQEEYRRMRASTKAYREHSFERYDPFLKKKSAVRDVTRIPGYTYDRSWRQKQEGENETKQDEINKSKSLLLKWKSISEKKEVKPTTAPSVVESEPKNKWALAKTVVQETVPTETESAEPVSTTKQVFETFLRNAAGQPASAPIRRIRRREKTFSYARDRTIFPGSCKSSYESRKFMEQEVTNIMFSLSPEGRRKANIDKLKAEAQLPNFVSRAKTLSAILRNFKEYKNKMNLEKSKTFLTV